MRRLTIVQLLAAATLLCLSSNASAYRADMISNYDGVSNLSVGDTVAITVMFDTEGAADVMVLGFGVIFDDGAFDYEPSSSTTPTYLLYVSPKIAYLQPASTCGPVCNIYGLPPPNQVQLDFLSSKILTPEGIPTPSLPGGESLGTYVFRVKDVSGGTAVFSFIFEDARGSSFALGDLTQPTLGGMDGTVTVNLPEPMSALLSMTALLTLAAVRTRRRADR